MANKASSWHPVQADFSGGMISTRMMMRADTEQYAKSVLQMLNFMPTLQGSAVRTPGTRFARTIVKEDGSFPMNARIFPYTTPDNRRVLLMLTADATGAQFNVLDGIENEVKPGTGDEAAVQQAGRIMNTTTGFRELVTNGGQLAEPNSLSKWTFEPEQYALTNDTNAGVWANANGNAIVRTVVWPGNDSQFAQYFEDTAFLRNKSNLIEYDLNQRVVVVRATLDYNDNYFGADAGTSVVLRVGTTPGGTEISGGDVDVVVPFGSQSLQFRWEFELPDTITDDYEVYHELEFRAVGGVKPDPVNSLPTWLVRLFGVFAYRGNDFEGPEVTPEDPAIPVPFKPEDLDAIQYVQSPYPSKEMVFVHPLYYPSEIVFSTAGGGGYIWREKPMERPEVPAEDPADPPIVTAGEFNPWIENNYPSCVTTFKGRLILAGGQTREETNASYETSNTETVWGSAVGAWNVWHADDSSVIIGELPNEAIQLTAIYRSPIQWVFGQKDLLIGALEMEYIASAEGIFRPGDLGVDMHSTHGSVNVQPVGFGETVLFPAESGTRVRGMSKSRDDEGWVSPDMTFFNPEICVNGIRRMVRMRNPHQMMVALLNNGTLAVFHQDTYAGMMGWSQMQIGGDVQDICVQVSEEGYDVLWLVNRRTVDGVDRLQLEAIYDWRDQNFLWDYSTNAVHRAYDEPTNVIGNLDHLNNKNVHVIAAGPTGDPPAARETYQSGYLGTFPVRDGEIRLVNQIGQRIEITEAVVGQNLNARMTTLPVAARDPGAAKRYSSISLRIRASTLPKVAVVSTTEPFQGSREREPERAPQTPMNQSEPLEVLHDVELTNLGWDTYQTVVVEENLPLRTEVLGIYGKLTSNSK